MMFDLCKIIFEHAIHVVNDLPIENCRPFGVGFKSINFAASVFD